MSEVKQFTNLYHQPFNSSEPDKRQFALQIEKPMDFKMLLKSRYGGMMFAFVWGGGGRGCYIFEQEASL